MGNLERELKREGEADDIEARTDVRRGRWDTNGERTKSHTIFTIVPD